MISVERARELLGDKAEGMTDAEVIAIRDELRTLAEICYESWLQKRKKSRGVKMRQAKQNAG